jgi:hypothetical protein
MNEGKKGSRSRLVEDALHILGPSLNEAGGDLEGLLHAEIGKVLDILR